MKIWNYFIAGVVALVEVFVALAVSSIPESSFEIVVLALLLIIYAFSRTLGVVSAYTNGAFVLRQELEFQRIRMLIAPDNYDSEFDKSEREKSHAEYNKIKTISVIWSLAMGAIYLIAVYNLLRAFS